MQRNCLRRVLGTLCFLLLVLTAHAQKYTVTGGQGTPLLAIDESANSSKFQVYLVYGMNNVEIRYTPTSSSYQWYRYKNKAGAGGDGERISSEQEGGTTVIRNIEEGYGYYVVEDDNMAKTGGYVWIIDYSKYAFDITRLYVDAERSNCDYMALGATADMKDMKYYAPSGSSKILDREFDITYQTMKLMGEDDIYTTVTVDTIIDPFKKVLPPPLCDTDVTLKGDLFARHFGVEKL